MVGRRLRSQLDLVKPDMAKNIRQAQDSQKKGYDAHAKLRSFAIGETVYTRNYAQGPRWLPGTVVDTDGLVLLHIKVMDGRILRRHVDQVRPCSGKSLPVSDEETEHASLLGGNNSTTGETNPQLPAPSTDDADIETQEPVTEPATDEAVVEKRMFEKRRLETTRSTFH